jgi:ribosomal protein S18 acetylase RimI-like enzyme
MMSVMARVYRPATAADVMPLAQSLAAAFERDPVWTWLLGGLRGRRGRLEHFFTLEIEHVILPAGTAYTADDVPGAALVLPPGRWRVPVSAQLRNGPGMLRVFGRRVGHALGFLTRMESRHLRAPHVYFPYVGVAPEHQRQGIGAALMAPAIEHADAQRLPCYLEASSPDNARLYRRLGFEDVEEVSFLGSPPVALMRRDPA